MVSIVLVTYNRAARLRLSIEDILRQTFKNFEVIICDDCSTDSTEEICREFKKRDPRIKYFRHEENIQMPANCNFGIEKAEHEYVAILHDGDRFKPDLIEQWYQAIAGNESVAFVFNSIGETDERNRIVNSYHEFEEGIVDRDQLLKDTFFRRWRFDSPVYGQAMVKKSLLKERGLLYRDFGFYADVDLWMDLLHDNDAYYCADTLITGPTKEIQPRLFEDGIINHFLLMFDMQLKHRKKAFANDPFRLSSEMLVLWVQSFFNLFYCLLLLVKNHSFASFIAAAGQLSHRVMFLIPWVITFVLYPILYPSLKLYSIIKGGITDLRPKLKRSKGEPVQWYDWLFK
jgi:glycosyltransferase involved in cell wall biosynthesis